MNEELIEAAYSKAKKNEAQLNDKTNINKSKNLFSGAWRVGGIDLDTGLNKNTSTWRNTDEIPVSPNTQYTASISEYANAYSVYIFYYDINKNPILIGGLYYTQLVYGFFPKVFTTPNDNRLCYIKIMVTGAMDTSNTQLELNFMQTSYRPASQKEISLDDLPNPISGYRGRRVFFLGDSITALTTNSGWTQYFMASVKPSSYINYAVGGATWLDDSVGVVYNGNPSTGSQNFIGNQVQKIINNSLSAPDCIIISAGTNDLSWTIPTDLEIENAFFDGSMNPISLASVDRTTWAGAVRWAIEQLKILYPKAVILLCSPVQRHYVSGTNNSTYASILAKNTILSKMALRMGVEFINTMECGIYGMTNVDFVDNLHPSVIAGRKISAYIERKYKSALSI